MKVKDLEKGMLLECTNDNDSFLVHGKDSQWLSVRARTLRGRRRENPGFAEDKIIMYLGTKNDIDIDLAWCDRFALIDKKIVGVDPAAWQRIKILDESR